MFLRVKLKFKDPNSLLIPNGNNYICYACVQNCYWIGYAKCLKLLKLALYYLHSLFASGRGWDCKIEVF